MDDRDDEFFATPFSRMGHQFLRAPQKGYQNRYLTHAGLADDYAIARFTPDLAAGRYEVLFHAQTPFADSEIPIRIRHAAGETAVRFVPRQAETRRLGVFDFVEGTDGYLEIAGPDSRGTADAVILRPVSDGASAPR